VLRHPLDDGVADAARGTGNDGDLAGEIEERQDILPNSLSDFAADLGRKAPESKRERASGLPKLSRAMRPETRT
jgi:hypothetical protein